MIFTKYFKKKNKRSW